MRVTVPPAPSRMHTRRAPRKAGPGPARWACFWGIVIALAGFWLGVIYVLSKVF